MELYEKNGNILYILNVLKRYSDEDHKLSVTEIKRKIEEIYMERKFLYAIKNAKN